MSENVELSSANFLPRANDRPLPGVVMAYGVDVTESSLAGDAMDARMMRNAAADTTAGNDGICVVSPVTWDVSSGKWMNAA